MKFFIPNAENFISGPKTFVTNLTNYLRNKVTLVEDPLKSDVIFFPVQFDLSILKAAKQKGIKIIQRLDGIYYPQKHNDYLEKNSGILEIYKNFADYVVFQSEYSRKQCFEMLGYKDPSQYSIIVNGVNKQIFTPNSNKSLSPKVKFISTGNFRNIDMIEPVVLALDKLKEKYDFEFNVLGKVRNPDLEHFFQRDYINMLGEVSMEEVAQHLKQNDIFLFSHLNPPCPNSVIEAVSAGLPVVGFDSGAMSELLFFSKEPLAEVSPDVLQTYAKFDYQKLLQKIECAIQDFGKLKDVALNNTHLYSFDSCGDSYLDVFENVHENF